MDIYLVGGAVRDTLLQFPHSESDWVVVGASPAQMLTAGFQQVGKDFPVFLHPETKEEYALARKERKTGSGYTGFEFDTQSTVSLEDDLLRRDLTINAIAKDSQGNLIDPYGGVADIKAKILRHVSDAFAEDPVRVLRIARFAARYHHLGFRVAPETTALMARMVNAGEVDHLVAERVWKEFSRALGEKSPATFIEVLRSCGALKILMPELDKLFGVPQPEQHHPEIDTGLHALLSLARCAELTPAVEARFATLMHDLGKGTTPKDEWPRHIGHEKRGVKQIEILCQRLSVPNACRDLALSVAEFHTHCHRALELTPKVLLDTLQRLDALRRPERLTLFGYCCTADSRGRTGMEAIAYPQANYLTCARDCVAKVDTKALVAEGYKGKEFGEALRKRQLQALAAFIADYRQIDHRKH